MASNTSAVASPVHAREVRVDAGRGHVRVRLPAGLQTSAAGWPLVLYLHGYGSTATDFEVHFGVSGRHSESEVGHTPPEERDDRGMIEVLANGRVDSQGNQFWAAWGDWVGDCRPSSSSYSYAAYAYEASLSAEDYWQLSLEHCGAADADVLYLRHLVAAVAQEVAVDPQRIAVLGHSNGAAMAYRLACEANDLFRAVVAISGSPPPEASAVGCSPARPTRLLHVHGTDDSVVLYGGRKGAYDGAVASVERFLAYNNCSTRQLPTGASLPGWNSGAPGAGSVSEIDLSRRVAGLDTEVWHVSDCASSGDVTLWKLVGEQHTPLMWRWGAPTTHEGGYQREVRHWLLQQPGVARRPPRTQLDARGGMHPGHPGSSAHQHAPAALIVMATLCFCCVCCCVWRRRRLGRKLDTLRLLTSVAVDVACSSATSDGSAAAAPAAAVQMTTTSGSSNQRVS